MSAGQQRLVDAHGSNLKRIPLWAVCTIQSTANTQVKYQWVEHIHKGFWQIVYRGLFSFAI